MPPIGLLLGKVDFSNLFITLNGDSYKTLQEAQAAGAVTINYGSFSEYRGGIPHHCFVIFIVIRQINRLSKTNPTSPNLPQTLSALLYRNPCSGITLPSLYLRSIIFYLQLRRLFSSQFALNFHINT
jgi:hypothetical protein